MPRLFSLFVIGLMISQSLNNNNIFTAFDVRCDEIGILEFRTIYILMNNTASVARIMTRNSYIRNVATKINTTKAKMERRSRNYVHCFFKKLLSRFTGTSFGLTQSISYFGHVYRIIRNK